MVARAHRRESGFAMLLVLLMAAVIAISLYLEMPRVAFESQRQKEQMLIERGEQYKRAVKVFFNTNKRWPAKIEDLENLNGRRYLRKRYIDPMTGKEEWRAIHISNGVLTDSKVTAAPGSQQGEKDKTAGQYITEMQGIGQTPTPGTNPGANIATRRRASDGLAPGVPTGAPAAVGETGEVQPGQQQPIPGQVPMGMPGQQGMPGMTGAQYPQYPQGVNQPGMPPGGIQGVTGATGPTLPGQLAPGVPYPVQGGRLASQVPGMPPGVPTAPGAQPGQGGGGYISAGAYIGSQPGTPQQQQYPGQGINPQTGAPYAPGQGYPPGAYPGQQQAANLQNQSDAARTVISNALYGPRPGGPPNVVAGGQVMGTGIAGFASTADAEGIMVYKDRTNYGEWEFVFDPSKDNRVFNPLQSNIGAKPGTGSNPGPTQLGPATPTSPGPPR